jgi:hypothetical protein
MSESEPTFLSMDTSWLTIKKMAWFRKAQFLDLDGLVGHA